MVFWRREKVETGPEEEIPRRRVQLMPRKTESLSSIVWVLIGVFLWSAAPALAPARVQLRRPALKLVRPSPSVPPSSRQVRPPIPLRLLSRAASNSPVGYQHTYLPFLPPTNLSPSKVRNPARALPFSPPAETKQKGGLLLVVATQTSMEGGRQKADRDRGSVVGRGWI